MTIIDERHNVELRHLEHFVAVAEERSFTRAGARLHLVQSTLSVSIRSLERELGGRLFDRTTHQVELTDTGRALLAEARNVLSAVDVARDAVAAAQGGLRGTVRVGIMHSLHLIDMAAMLTRYHRERPAVRIIPITAQRGSAELAARVADGDLDMAFAALPGEYPPGVTAHRLASEPMLLACPADDPLAARDVIPLADLDGARFVDFPVGWGIRNGVDRLFLGAGLHRVVAVEVTDIPTAVDLVRAGFGYGFLSPSLTVGSRPVALRPVAPTQEFEVSLLTPAERHSSAAARALIDVVLAS
ncbi:DNA-binding transcriptional LysR family regulator [Catenulispora sp. EB89]|uniref:LysR family transcriptional regulator n=1 Tax=Catenulispora sp. EB89 TaxID=3156257 RepID=UPI0035161AFF